MIFSVSKAVHWTAGIILLALVISIVVVEFLHFDPLCGEETISEKISPDGRYVAVLMRRGCGATTSYVAHINLRTVTSKFRPDFLGGTITDGEVFTSSRYSGDRFCWSKPHTLSIGYSDLATHKWRDVTIKEDFRNPECR